MATHFSIHATKKSHEQKTLTGYGQWGRKVSGIIKQEHQAPVYLQGQCIAGRSKKSGTQQVTWSVCVQNQRAAKKTGQQAPKATTEVIRTQIDVGNDVSEAWENNNE